MLFKKRSDNAVENGELLKLRVLLCLLQSDNGDATVTGIARTLSREKYAISRAVSALEREDLLSRADAHRLVLTHTGRREAEVYAERLRVCMDHLLFEGIDLECARQDALLLARYCSEDTMKMIRSMAARCRMKYDLRSRRQFSGAVLCQHLDDGAYPLPFMIYREHMIGGSNISTVNEGFDHPCVLNVADGVGTIHLRAVSMTRRAEEDGSVISAKIRSMKYFDNGRFVAAERYGDLFAFPADVLTILNFGSNVGQVLHGSVCLEFENASEPGGHAQAIFALFI